MLTFFLADRIKETSRVEGTGNIPLDGAAPGFSSFDDFYASGDVVFYTVADKSQYEVGSGIYRMSGPNRVLTRSVLRSSNIDVGPWYVSGTTAKPFPSEISGFFYPLWLSKSAALSGVGLSGGPYSDVSGINFANFPGQTFYYVPGISALGVGSLAGSGSNFNAASVPVNFSQGLKEVFVTYPGKTSVYTGWGLGSGLSEPKSGGIAFWHNEQLLNYDSDLVWDTSLASLGVGVRSPTTSIDAKGFVRASGFMENGSGVLFVGGPGVSGGRQLEPFLRNRLGGGAAGVVQLSGLVSEFIGFAKQNPATVFAGPISGCMTPPCDPDYPTFRLLTLDDLPINAISGFIQGFIPGATSGVILQDHHYIFDSSLLPNIPGADSGVILQDDHYIFDQSFIPGGESGVIYQDNHYIFDQSFIPSATSGVILQDNYYIFDGSLLPNIPGADSGVILQDDHYIFDQSFIPGAESGIILQDNHYIFDQSLIPGAESGVILQDDHYIFDQSLIPGATSGVILQDNHYIFDDSLIPTIPSPPQAVSGLTFQDDTYIMDPSGIGNLNILNFPSSNVVIRAADPDLIVPWSGGPNSVAVGSEAGLLSYTTSNGTMVGLSAGRNASGLFDCVFLGANAGRGVRGFVGASGLNDGRCPSLIAIGKEAMLSGVNAGQIVAIGDFAGAYSSGLFHSVLIGRGAGYGRSGRNSIIISNRSALLPDYDANWAPSGKIEVLDIGRSIQGLMGFSDTSRDVRIHIGLPLASGTYRDEFLLDNAALNLTPGVSNRSSLVLYANPDGQSQALMRSEMAYINDNWSVRLNTIINSSGMLTVPVATAVSGSDIISQNGYIIPTGQGVLAGWKVGSERGIAVCIDGTWHKISGVPV